MHFFIQQRMFIVAVALYFCSSTQFVFAEGEHSRRAATEIKVMIGDIRRMQAPNTLPIHKLGLKHRLQGGLAALDILLRLADQETGKPVSHYAHEVGNLTKWIENNEFTKAESLLKQWEQNYSLTLLKVGAGENHTLGKKLHQEFCAACHDTPNAAVERPAYNLFHEASEMDYAEFLARLFVGVRGDSVTGIDNPLSDYEISALVAYYRHGKH